MTLAPARERLALAGVFAAGILIRLALLPTVGVRDDTDRFAGWVHEIAVGQFGQTYRLDMPFPPIMAYLFGVLGAVQSLFRTATDAADVAVRIALKAPATLADLGLALGVAWFLRARPAWAVVGAAAILLHPAVFEVSAWWGQFESIYVLAGLVAFLLAASGRPWLGAVALGIALMTKPQAIVFVAPFAGWYVGRYGWQKATIAGLVTLATIGIVWAPFLADGGIGRYLGNLEQYQNDVFAVLSLRAWNPWWLLQLGAGGDFLSDHGALLGPLSPRLIGLGLFGLAELGVFAALVRRPEPRVLALGLAASVLAAFTVLTTMHERYAYGVIVFLALLLPEREPRRLWLVLSVAFTANLLTAIPPPFLAGIVPSGGGILGVPGSIALTSIAVALGVLLWRAARGRWPEPEPAPGDGQLLERDPPDAERRANRPRNAATYQRT